jgi:hypothetical protein
VLVEFLDLGDVGRLQALPALGHLVAHLIAFFEGLESLTNYARMVHEDVLASVVRLYEAVTLVLAEPLDRPLSHDI